ncbi:hypothetical protein [Natronorubrum thiooxidans]|nr:hypothetical protein [Natronorubrum thiooxidans]
MAVETEAQVRIGTTQTNWISAGLAGVAAGIVFGVLAAIMMPDMMGMVGALYGFGGNTVVGWIAHLIHSLVFGLVYAALVTTGQLRPYAGRVLSGAGIGLVYGVVVWVVAASIVMPLWIGWMTGMAPPVPDFNVMSLVGHAVYGVLLGAAYPLILVRMGQ